MDSLPRACTSLAPGLVPVPASSQEGICRVCHGACPPQYPQCYPCLPVAHTGLEILPISLSVHDGLLHTHLSQYKNSESKEVRTRATNALSALTADFFSRHHQCVGKFDVVTTIPSPRRDAAAFIVNSVSDLQPLRSTTLEVSRASDRLFDPTRFEVVGDVDGQRILLFDDTFTSGGSVFSAAGALTGAGAIVTTAVVVGRHFRSDFETSRPLWKWLKDRTWQQGRCARCNGEMKDHPSLF